MTDDVQVAEAHFAKVVNDGVVTHIAKVRFPGNVIAVGIGATPELAMQDAFKTIGAEKFSYGPAYHWNKPPWLSETGNDETDEGTVETGLDDDEPPLSH
jgi:hypothetical protein